MTASISSLGFLFFAAFLAATANAQNLVPNPGFDQPDLDGWVPTNLAYSEWSSRDENGSPSSGSMRFYNFGLSNNQIRRCIPVIAGKSYTYGASAFIPAPGQNSQLVGAAIQFWSSDDCDGQEIASTFAGLQVAIRDAWGPIQGSASAPPGAHSAYFYLISTAASRTTFEVFLDNVFFVEDATCVPMNTALCLNGQRFLITVEWATDQGVHGYGRAVPLTDDSGYFWFFNDANVELVTKLLDACPTAFDRYWFFASGLTDVETKLRVVDTQKGAVRNYLNPQKTPFAAIQDTDAFATCP